MQCTSANTLGGKFLRNEQSLTLCVGINKEPSCTDNFHDSWPNAMAAGLILQWTILRLSSRFGPPWPSWGHFGCVSMCRQAAIG